MKRITLIVVIIVSQILILTNNAFTIEDENMFVVRLNSDDTEVLNVSIDVYSAELYQVNDELQQIYYAENLCGSYESTNNLIVFKRPSECFSISIRDETIPDGYGVDVHTRFLMSYEKELIINIKKIDHAAIIFDSNNKHTIKLYSSDNTVLNANIDSSIVKSEKENEELRPIIKSGDVFIPINEIVYLDNQTVESEQNTTANRSSSDSSSCCLISNRNSYISRTTNTAYSDDYHFRVNYNPEQVSAYVAKAVANEFMNIDNLFCTQNGFLRPWYSLVDSGYYIEIKDCYGNFAETEPLSGNGSIIYVDINTAINVYQNLNPDNPTYNKAYKGVLAHEYMHAILLRYGFNGTSDDIRWFHESFSSWAGFIYNSHYAQIREYDVYNFVNTQVLPLTYFSSSFPGRHYGSCVFPIYIHKNMGGYNTIKKIYESLSTTSNSLDAIESGLTYYGYTFKDALSGCAAYNSYPNSFYTNSHGLWIQENKQTGSITAGIYEEYQLLNLSCRYIEYEATTSTSKTLTVTVDFTTQLNTSNSACKTVTTTSYYARFISTNNPSNQRYTIVQSGFSTSGIRDVVIVPVNISKTSSNSFRITAHLLQY